MLRQEVADLPGGHHALPRPAVVAVQRHLLDEAQIESALQGEGEEIGCLVVVLAAHQHCIDLHGMQIRRQRGVDPREHVGQAIAAGQSTEGVRVDRVE